ncbi:hypothetical protein DUNSADRAFT_3051 [Dunaliella salina]|uniref:Uncharacterized protein n=1 Tax=Dunaliella salina TaxID=3046 RepID=A0ABQ7GUL8_DUNSA|nr:hypothetical protein DUNSADRAFT_3051 [Dunaliella salina]|eukprot:KAF5838319.1 hypothetical protein DUNSADRAFT_3051 [Dunaliella salina]
MLGHGKHGLAGISLKTSCNGCSTLPLSAWRRRADLASWRRNAPKQRCPQAQAQVGSTALDPKEIAQEFVHNWFTLLASKSEKRHELERLCAPSIRLVPDSALIPQTADIQGVHEVLDQLSAQHASYSKENHKIHAAAASDATDSSGTTVFVLVEFWLKDTAATPQHPATFRVSQGFGIFRLEVDGSVVHHVELKRQLTHEEVDGILLDSIHVYPAPFPLHELHEGHGRQGQDAQDPRQHKEQRHQAAAVVKRWVDAHAADADLSTLNPLLSQDSRLFEAYGILLPTFPALPSPPTCTVEKQPTMPPALGQLQNRSRFIPGSLVSSLLQVLQSSYSVLELRDMAIAVDDSANLAFASWSSTVINKCSARTFKVREMHAITLAPPDVTSASESCPPQWKLRSIWALRDPYDFEKDMLLRPEQQEDEALQPPGGSDLYADLIAGLPNPRLPNPQDIISAVQQKVGAVEGLPWAAIAQSLGEVASAFSAASAAAAARAQGTSASERAQGVTSEHADAAPGKKGDSAAPAAKQGDSAAAAAARLAQERPDNKSAVSAENGHERESLGE